MIAIRLPGRSLVGGSIGRRPIVRPARSGLVIVVAAAGRSIVCHRTAWRLRNRGIMAARIPVIRWATVRAVIRRGIGEPRAAVAPYTLARNGCALIGASSQPEHGRTIEARDLSAAAGNDETDADGDELRDHAESFSPIGPGLGTQHGLHLSTP